MAPLASASARSGDRPLRRRRRHASQPPSLGRLSHSADQGKAEPARHFRGKPIERRQDQREIGIVSCRPHIDHTQGPARAERRVPGPVVSPDPRIERIGHHDGSPANRAVHLRQRLGRKPGLIRSREQMLKGRVLGTVEFMLGVGFINQSKGVVVIDDQPPTLCAQPLYQQFGQAPVVDRCALDDADVEIRR